MKHVWYWCISVSVSLVLLCALLLQWQRVDSSYRPNAMHLFDDSAVSQFLDGLQASTEKLGENHPIYLPTGVYIEAMKFVSSNDVQVSGYIWQIYDDEVHAGLSRDYLFPDTVDSTSSANKTLAYQRRVGKQEIFGWYFEATLRQKFVYAKYPFDHKTVWLRIWHKDFDRNIVLVPHFQSYSGSTQPGVVFGIKKDIVLGAWRLEETFYDYRLSDYDTDFGLQNYIGQHDFPELQFNLVLKRQFVDALIINLVPLMVVAVLMFSVVMLTTGDPKKADVFGFNTAMVFGTCSALFFVVMLSHISLREQFSGVGLVYMEYFYLMMYFIILAVAGDAYCFSSKCVSQQTDVAVEDLDNLRSKLLFWPILLGLSVMITYVVLDT